MACRGAASRSWRGGKKVTSCQTLYLVFFSKFRLHSWNQFLISTISDLHANKIPAKLHQLWKCVFSPPLKLILNFPVLLLPFLLSDSDQPPQTPPPPLSILTIVFDGASVFVFCFLSEGLRACSSSGWSVVAKSSKSASSRRMTPSSG